MRSDLVERFITKSLQDLQLDYIDLYLIHWPIGMEFRGEDQMFPMVDINTKECAYDLNTNLEQIWKAMELQVKAGRAKAIGLSNFNEAQIQRILKIAEIPPANLQVHKFPILFT